MHYFVVVCEQDDVLYSFYPSDIAQVMGAHFERLGSKPFAVYTIRVQDTEERTWRIQRRYRGLIVSLVEIIYSMDAIVRSSKCSKALRVYSGQSMCMVCIGYEHKYVV